MITAATLKLAPRPSAEPVTVVGSFGSLRAAGDAVAAVVQAGLTPSLMELMDRATLRSIHEWKNIGLDDGTVAMLIAQADGPDSAACAAAMTALFEQAGADYVAQSADPEEAAQLLGIRRMAYGAAERLGSCLVEDVCVPRSKLPDLLALIEQVSARREVLIFTVAHAGDGNAHPTFVFDRQPDGEVPGPVWAAADEIFQAALDMGRDADRGARGGRAEAALAADGAGPGRDGPARDDQEGAGPAGAAQSGEGLLTGAGRAAGPGLGFSGLGFSGLGGGGWPGLGWPGLGWPGPPMRRRSSWAVRVVSLMISSRSPADSLAAG